VVPGFYGTNSVKWLTRITLAETRASGPFTTRWYNDPLEDDASGRTAPVWAIAPQSVIVAPAPEAAIKAQQAVEVWGWAWADGGVVQVEVSVDGGDWRPAQLEDASDRGWQRFAISWVPSKRAAVTLASRASSVRGECQPESGRRNAIYRVRVMVV